MKRGTEAYDGQRCVNTDEYLAFCTPHAYGDFEGEFRFRWDGGGHGGAGMIFRAQDVKHYYLAHLPACGQCIRGSHFWACISLVDESGWAKILKMEMLHGVATELMTWRAYRIDTALWAMGKMIEAEPDLVLYVYMDSYESYLRGQYLRVTSDGVEPVLDMLPQAVASDGAVR